VIVVDTNILAYRFIAGTRNEEADRLAAMEPRWAAPLLWRSELRNVLSGYLQRGQMPQHLAENIMQEALFCLSGGEYPARDSVVFHLVSTSQCTAYDCEFVALAMMLDVPLVTEDGALLRAFPTRCQSLTQSLAN
jgi:predicted nucleic acid-binding protein